MLETVRRVLSKRGDELRILQQPEIVYLERRTTVPFIIAFLFRLLQFPFNAVSTISGYLEVSFVAVKHYTFIGTVRIILISMRRNLPSFPTVSWVIVRCLVHCETLNYSVLVDENLKRGDKKDYWSKPHK